MKNIKSICSAVRIVYALLVVVPLTGCPGYGDIMVPVETTSVAINNDNVCFFVANQRDYQPIIIAINPRDIPLKAQSFTDRPNLKVSEGRLCIPPSFYRFENGRQYVTDYVLTPNGVDARDKFVARRVVVAFEIADGQAHLLKLNNDEY
ncbi:putative T6SS immunity periplasmic lipoprotein [Franconibacter daqui]|uniref:T6SS immunity periplasmic lipoprotein n=1 Tax=Franconibacter daqui TaxID=2047724 RepID=A0ABV1PKR1_9ENTR